MPALAQGDKHDKAAALLRWRQQQWRKMRGSSAATRAPSIPADNKYPCCAHQ
jgi:hypothetical protein